MPAFKVKAVDTTAAGDVFNGALAVAMSEGQSLEQSVRFASAAAALSVTRLGAAAALGTGRRRRDRIDCLACQPMCRTAGVDLRGVDAECAVSFPASWRSSVRDQYGR